MTAQKGQFYDGSGGSVYHWEEFVSGPKVSPSRCGRAFRGFFRRLNVLSCKALNKIEDSVQQGLPRSSGGVATGNVLPDGSASQRL